MRGLGQWTRRRLVVLCLTVLGSLLAAAPALPAGWTPADLPIGVDPTEVVVGVLFDATGYDPGIDNPVVSFLVFRPSTQITAADLDADGSYTAPAGTLFLPAYPTASFSVDLLKTLASQPVDLDALDARLQTTIVFGDGATAFSTEGLQLTDFSQVTAIALESDDVTSDPILKSFFEGFPKYMLGTKDDLTALMDNAISYGTAIGLQPDDPGLLAIVAAIEEGTIKLTIDPPEPTEDVAAILDAVGAHQQSRLRNLINAQPDLVGVVIAGEAATSDVAAPAANGYAPFSFGPDQVTLSRRGPIWFDLSAAYDLAGDTDPYLFGVFGAHVAVSDDIYLGGMVEFDGADSAGMSGSGWLAGPYLVAKVPGFANLDARLLYGRATDTGDVLGLADDSVESERLLASIAFSRPASLGDITLSPRLAASYAAERSEAYTTDLGSDIPSVETGVLQLDASADAAFAVGDVAVTTGLGVSWSDTIVGDDSAADGFGGTAAIALDWALSDAASVNLGLDLKGLGGAMSTGTIRAGLTGSY